MLAITTSAFSQNVTNDTLVYVPKYLMESLMSDLDKCDLDRIALNKYKAELALLYIDLAKNEVYIKSLNKEIYSLREQQDTLEAANMQMAIEYNKEIKKNKRAKNWWFTTTIAATLSAVGIHYNWKESWIK